MPADIIEGTNQQVGTAQNHDRLIAQVFDIVVADGGQVGGAAHTQPVFGEEL